MKKVFTVLAEGLTGHWNDIKMCCLVVIFEGNEVQLQKTLESGVLHYLEVPLLYIFSSFPFCENKIALSIFQILYLIENNKFNNHTIIYRAFQ